MNSFWTFVGNMTVWNWLALIAFIFFPLSALNSFFSLRSRYRDWRGTKSKKAFERRLKHLSEELQVIEIFKNNIKLYFDWFLDAAITPVKTFGLAFMLLLFAFLLPGDIFRTPIGLFALLLTMTGAGAASHLFRIIRFVAIPVSLAIEIIDFVKNASDKGLESENGKTLIIRLYKSEMFSQAQKEEVSGYLTQHYPSMIPTIFHNVQP